MPALLPATQRRLATIQAAANYVSCNPRTIRRMIARGDITGYRYGKRLIRVSLDEVDDALRPIPTASIGGGDRASA
jgi:excisionase family DNA binding protein